MPIRHSSETEKTRERDAIPIIKESNRETMHKGGNNSYKHRSFRDN